MTFWIWVFGDIDGLRWVLERNRMAFPEHAAGRARRIAAGDSAVLYTTRGAYSNPTRDRSRLQSIVDVVGEANHHEPVEIAGREVTWSCPIQPRVVLEERQGPEVAPLAAELEHVKRPAVWGQYFRNSPIAVSARDFDVLAKAVEHRED